MDHAHSLGLMQEEFRTEYRKALGNARETGRHLAVTTIYRPRFHLDPASGLTGLPEDILTTLNPLLSVFNDVIQEESACVGADVLDLRRICYKDEHFANPIEPSELGGRCIAEDLCTWLKRLPVDDLSD